MKTIKYLKLVRLGRITYVIKITEDNILDVDYNKISVSESDGLDAEYKFYTKTLDCVEATREEFDTFFIKTVGLINEFSKL
jgi:hypothetical protein